MQVLQQHGVSLRRSCALCRISRSSYAYRRPSERVQQDKELVSACIRLHVVGPALATGVLMMRCDVKGTRSIRSECAACGDTKV